MQSFDLCDNTSSSLLLNPWPECEGYCDCYFPDATVWVQYEIDRVLAVIKCRCGEDDPATHTLLWNWHECSETDAQIYGPTIVFHPTYSQGTAIVRGQTPLAPDMIHFWEMRVLTPLCGSDVMFGIGTDKMDLNEFKYRFLSALGNNSQSWGFSFMGKFRHNGEWSKDFNSGKHFSQGSILGILLDRVHGTLEYFLNRRSLGVIYTGIPNDGSVKIYPMVCSTVAKCCIRLINATSQFDCLKLKSFKALVKQPNTLAHLKQLPGLKHIFNNYWFLNPPIRYSRKTNPPNLDLLDEAILALNSQYRYEVNRMPYDIDNCCECRNNHAYNAYESDDEVSCINYVHQDRH